MQADAASHRLHKVNNVLLALILLVNACVIGAPLLPALLYNLHRHTGQQAKLTRQLHARPSASSPPVQQQNHIVIPAMLLDTPIYEGSVQNQYKILDQGIWRYPNGSTPDKGGNTVLIGHRFTYTNPKGIFYYLNKLKTGDEIGLWWSDKEYLYKVSTISVVPPTDTAIEKPSTIPQLTLFTCTPLWSPKDRLVVVAQEIQE